MRGRHDFAREFTEPIRRPALVLAVGAGIQDGDRARQRFKQALAGGALFGRAGQLHGAVGHGPLRGPCHQIGVPVHGAAWRAILRRLQSVRQHPAAAVARPSDARACAGGKRKQPAAWTVGQQQHGVKAHGAKATRAGEWPKPSLHGVGVEGVDAGHAGQHGLETRPSNALDARAWRRFAQCAQSGGAHDRIAHPRGQHHQQSFGCMQCGSH